MALHSLEVWRGRFVGGGEERGKERKKLGEGELNLSGVVGYHGKSKTSLSSCAWAFLG